MMPTFYELPSYGTSPPRSIYVQKGPRDRLVLSKPSGEHKARDKMFAASLEARGFYINRDDDCWHGPTGCKLDDDFVRDADKYYSLDLIRNILTAIDNHARHINVYWSKHSGYKVDAQ